MSSMSAALRFCASSSIAEKTEMLDLSGGICAEASHLPLAYLSKSSPGFTDVSISDLSIPETLPWACCCAAFWLLLVLQALSATADAMANRNARFTRDPPGTALPLPDVAARRAAGLFDQRTRTAA